MDQLIGLLLLGLGFKAPMDGMVQGETTDVVQTVETRKEKAAELRALYQTQKANVREVFEKKREAFQDAVTQKREERKEKRQERKEALKEKLETFKDQKKAAVVERVDQKMDTVNTNRTDTMTKHLTKMSEVLEKVTARAVNLKSGDVDTSSVDAAIAAAQTAINTAQSAVTAQAGKAYELTVESEETVKTTVGESMSGLQADLKAVHRLVMAARIAVGDAMTALTAVAGATKEAE